MGCYAGIELACLDACGRATGRRLCELLGGPARDPVEFAAYLFYRYAADNPTVLADPSSSADARGKGVQVPLTTGARQRTPEAMRMAGAGQGIPEAVLASASSKLKGASSTPDQEPRDARGDGRLAWAWHAARWIDPNGRWRVETAIRIGRALKDLPMEYYEDPVNGQADMAKVRRETGSKDEHEHVRDPLLEHLAGRVPDQA